MGLTGGLAASGKAALLAMKIWEEEINAKGGLLGRPVKLIYYDDQSNPATVPGIFTKLLDVDKVDLVIERLRHQPDRAGDADRHSAQHDFLRAVRSRREPRVQLPEIFLDEPDRRPRSQCRLLKGILRTRGGAEPEAENPRDHRR